MAHHNEGQNVVYGMMAATTLMAVGAYNAHERGIAALRAAREVEDDARYDAAVANTVRDAEELGQLAMRLAQELAAERAKNESLTRALSQRQALLERMRTRAIWFDDEIVSKRSIFNSEAMMSSCPSVSDSTSKPSTFTGILLTGFLSFLSRKTSSFKIGSR
ncbi:hypothetical protein ACNT8L_04195 [Brucella intermedia]